MSKNPTNPELKSKVELMLQGWSQPSASPVTPIVVRGETLAPSAVRQRVQAFFDLLDAPDQMRLLLRAAISQRRAGEAVGWKFIDDLSSVVVQQFGDAEASKRFGVALPKEPAKPSTETLVIANDQRQKTRQARGILGKRQREALGIHPKVTVVVTTSSASPPEAALQVPETR